MNTYHSSDKNLETLKLARAKFLATQKPRIQKSCTFCGVTFSARASDSKRKFCSNSCRYAANKGTASPLFKDLTKQRFGSLVATSFAGFGQRGQGSRTEAVWRCLCDCGNDCEKTAQNLRSGHVKSCGCTRHGEAKHTAPSLTYESWRSMKRRCLNQNASDFERYGGRGITICEEWKASFLAFKRDAGERPSKMLSIDRIDNSRGYEPGNVKWSTAKEQANNRRKQRKRKCITQK